jgi:ankyrin repeat protein
VKKKVEKMPFTGQSIAHSIHILFLLQVCLYLLKAAESGDVNTTKRWAHCNSDSCTTDDGKGETPLIVAGVNGHVEVVRVLLDGGADVQRGNVYMNNALHRAATSGSLEVCRLLLDSGAKVNTQGARKATALQEAARFGHLSVAKLLVDRGADIRLKDWDDRTAADWARTNRHTAIADWLDSVRCL